MAADLAGSPALRGRAQSLARPAPLGQCELEEAGGRSKSQALAGEQARWIFIAGARCRERAEAPHPESEGRCVRGRRKKNKGS